MYFTFLVLFSQCLACSMKYSEASDQLVYQGRSHQASKELLGKKQYWAPACSSNGLWMSSFRAAELRCYSLKLSHEDKWLCFSLEKMSTTHFPFIYAARACTGDSDALWFNNSILKVLVKKRIWSSLTVLRLKRLSPICWDCVTHRKKVQFSFDQNTSKNKKTMTFSNQHLTAPFCSSRSMSSVLEPSPVLQTHPWYIFLTEQLVVFFYFPYFLELDDRHIILVLKWAMIKLGFNIRTYLNKVWELSIISPSIREMKILELSRNCCNCACTNSHSSCRLLLNPCPSSFFPPCEKSQGYYIPCIFILYTASFHSQFCTTTIWNISLWEALLSYGFTKSVKRHGKLHPHHQKGPLHQSVVRASFSYLLCC